MKALSIRQPWAWLIIRPDITDPHVWRQAREDGLIKDIENRSWPTKHRGDFLIHASALYTHTAHEQYCRVMQECFDIKLPAYEQMQTGGIIGMASLVDCVQMHPSRWKEANSWGFVLINAKPMPFTPLKGRLNFFDVPDELLQKVTP